MPSYRNELRPHFSIVLVSAPQAKVCPGREINSLLAGMSPPIRLLNVSNLSHGGSTHILPTYPAPSLSDRYAQGSSRLQRDLRSVSLEDRSRLRPVNGTSAGRSLGGFLHPLIPRIPFLMRFPSKAYCLFCFLNPFEDLFTPLEIRTSSIYFLNIACPFLTSSISRELKHLVRSNMLHNI